MFFLSLILFLNLYRFLVNLYYSFQDKDYLYLVMQLIQGGTLRFHINQKKKFSEEQTSKLNY